MIQYSEKQIDSYLKSRIKNLQGMYIKLGTRFISGLPDRLLLISPAKVFFVELKAPGEEPRKLQQFMHRKLKSLGFSVDIVDSYASADILIKKILDSYVTI